MKSLINIYIDFTKKNIKKYMKMIFERKYNEDVTNEFIKTYINARYYNITNTEKNIRTFYQRILEELNIKADRLNSRSDIEDKEIIEQEKNIFEYILFFDNVRDVENVKEFENIRDVVKKIGDIRNKELNMKNSEAFEEKLYTQVMDDILEKEIFLEKAGDSSDFSLEFSKNKDLKDLYSVTLNYNIKMPMQYSEDAIEKVYNSGLIAEEKLKVEYNLLTVVAVRDILNGEFKDKYIVEISISLLKKRTKLDGILSILDNQALQDKIYINIMYEDYEKYKKIILECINKGYNFTITLDNSLKDAEEVEKLKMFKLILVPENLNVYKNVMKKQEVLKNIINK